MKVAEILKPEDAREALEQSLFEILSKISLKIETGSLKDSEADVRLKVNSKEWHLELKFLRNGQPREVRQAAYHIQNGLRTHGKRNVYGVILAPFISEETALICGEEGLGYVDLTGNAHLAFGGVYVEIRSGGRPNLEKRELQSLFSPKACRVLRWLLQGPLKPWKVLELHLAAQVSLGLVSGVKKQLLDREWTQESSHGIEVIKPNAILDAWAKADNWEKRTTVRDYSTLIYNPMELAGKVKEALAPHSPIFTQWFAAALRHPHTVSPMVSAYVREFPDEALIKEKLMGRQVNQNGVLRLIKPKDEGVFLTTKKMAQGFTLVSDIQIYLDLLGAGLRAEEQAQELRRWPDFSGGWL